MFSHIVVGLKEEQDHEALLQLALQVAAPEAKIHLVTLVRVGPNDDELRRIQQADQVLASHTERLQKAEFDASQQVGPVTVAAAWDLLNIVEQRKADLAVIGLAKRTRVGKALMGSDAQRLLLGASCPLLVQKISGV